MEQRGRCPEARCPAEPWRAAVGMEHAEDCLSLSLRPDLSAARTNCASDALSNYLLALTPRPLLLRLAPGSITAQNEAPPNPAAKVVQVRG